MPTYLYKCEKCGNEFEEIHRIAEREIPTKSLCKISTCPQTNGDIFCGGEISIVPQAPSMMYTMRDGFRRHTSDGFKDRMKEIHRSTPGSQLGDYA